MTVFSLTNILITTALSGAASALLLLCALKSFAALQQLGYNNKKFIAWTKKSNNMLLSRLILLSFLIFLSFCVINFSLAYLGKTAASYTGFSAFFLFLAVFIYADRKYALKVPLKNTKRLIRLKATFAVLVFAVCFALMLLLALASEAIKSDTLFLMRFLPLAILPMLIPVFVATASAVNALYENPRNKKFAALAAEKIKNSNIKIVAVTGSFGKTSVKNIITTLLGEKYRVLAAKGSYNTPMGVALTINNNNLDEYDYLVLEMGARNVGDIKELCEIAPPDIAIINGICPQHLETFKTLDAIKETKYEIAKYAKENAVLVLGRTACELGEKYSGKKLVFGQDFDYDNLKGDINGISFDFNFGGKTTAVKCVLLGAHNAENVCVAAAAATAAGLSFEDIKNAALKIKFEKHRLELIKSPQGLNILDDSYNANVLGAQAALEVLKTMPGKKAVVTPGIVELGVLEECENFALGEKLAFCDLVILVGETLVRSVTDGLVSKSFDENNLYIVPSLQNIGDILVKQLRPGDTVLFLNDLPDVYN